jgi:hypothetical protein
MSRPLTGERVKPAWTVDLLKLTSNGGRRPLDDMELEEGSVKVLAGR